MRTVRSSSPRDFGHNYDLLSLKEELSLKGYGQTRIYSSARMMDRFRHARPIFPEVLDALLADATIHPHFKLRSYRGTFLIPVMVA